MKKLLLSLLVLAATATAFAGNWTKVTDTATLAAGGTFIIGYQDPTATEGVIVPMQNTGTASASKAGYLYAGATSGTASLTTIDMATVTDTGMFEVTIAQSTVVTDAVVIKIGDNFIGNTDSGNDCKLFAQESAQTAFTPTVDGGVFTLTIKANSKKTTLQCNTADNGKRFAVYGGTQQNVVIYKKTGGAASKQSAGLAWSKTKVSLAVGEAFEAPTFSQRTTAAVTFASDNTAVATVSADGLVALAGDEGTAVITATSPENNEYEAGTAQFTVTVCHYNVYKKATAITSGKQYLLVAQRDGKTYYAIPLDATKNYGYISVTTLDELTDRIAVKSVYNDAFTLAAVAGGYSIQDPSGRYPYADGSHASFQMGTEPQTWTAELQTDGTFKLTNNGYTIYWGNSTYTTFGLYSDGDGKMVMPFLYEYDPTDTSVGGILIAPTTQPTATYNLSGQRVNATTKGIVISGGRKHINN